MLDDLPKIYIKHSNILVLKLFTLLIYIETWSYFRGDRVQVLVGPDKGKQGLINQIIQERNWVFVEGLNWKHTKFGDTKNFPGIVLREEKPLLVREKKCTIDTMNRKYVHVSNFLYFILGNNRHKISRPV